MAKLETEHLLRKWLAQRLGHPEVPTWLWGHLDDRGFVRDALASGSIDDRAALLEEARHMLGVFREAERRVPNRSRGRRLAVHAFLTSEEAARAEVVSRALARQAAQDGAVLRFRKGVLGGGVLSLPEAALLLASPAPYLLSRAAFEADSIPILGHHANLVRRGSTRASTAPEERVGLTVKWAKGTANYRMVIPRPAPGGAQLDLPWHLAGKIEQFPVLEGSVFAELRWASKWLAERLPWSPWDALWFVLTGTAPSVQPLQLGTKHWKGEAHERLEITISVEPWVSAKTLARLFIAHQRALLGRENRPISVKNLALLDFVMAQRESGSAPVGWTTLMAKWNRTHPTWGYGDVRHFQRDHLRVRRAVLSPGYPALGLVRP